MDTNHCYISALTASATPMLGKILFPYHNWPASKPSGTKTDYQYLTAFLLSVFHTDHNYLMPLPLSPGRDAKQLHITHIPGNSEGLSFTLEPAKKLLSPYTAHSLC